MAEFTMQHQSETNWCWAAVAVAIHNFLDPDPSPAMTQNSLATQVLQKLEKIPPTVDCGATPDQCNFTADLQTVFKTSVNLLAALPNEVLTFNSLKAQIDGGRPVCAQINWFGGGAHAIALVGYKVYASGLQTISVQDPNLGPGTHFYDDLVNDYPPGGVWADTFTVKP